MKHLLLFSVFSLLLLSLTAQPTAFTGCPNNNVAVVRDGNNSAETNPFYIYNVNTGTGTVGSGTGPVLNPTDETNLQLNGIGFNTVDGFLYGIQPGSVNNPLQGITNRPFYRLGANAVAQQVGTLLLPSFQSGENIGAINAAAGEIDNVGNYYFSAATGTLSFTPTPSATVKTVYLGKLANVTALTAGTSNLAPSYTIVTPGDANTVSYYNSILVTATGANYASVSNTGLRDLVYNKADGMIYSYVTFPDPSNSAQFLGQLIKIDPVSGKMTATLAPAVVPFADANNEVAGSLLDKDGNFLILFTNGAIYRADGSGATTLTGTVSLLSSPSGLEGASGTLRGDMASCGSTISSGPLPIILNYFNAFVQNNTVMVKWETASEINTAKFILERSTDAANWSAVYTVNATGNSGAVTDYSYNDVNAPATIVFYRLKTINTDGTFTYSNIKKVSLNTKNISLSYYPNPVKNIVYVESNTAFANTYSVRVNDITGRVYNVSFSKADINKIKVDMSALAPGTYFLQVDVDGTNKNIQKIIRQ